MDDHDFKRAKQSRNDAFEDDDLEWARAALADGTPHEVVVMVFHKARYECTEVSEKKRRESQVWLHANGVTRLTGDAVKIGDPLPV